MSSKQTQDESREMFRDLARRRYSELMAEITKLRSLYPELGGDDIPLQLLAPQVERTASPVTVTRRDFIAPPASGPRKQSRKGWMYRLLLPEGMTREAARALIPEQQRHALKLFDKLNNRGALPQELAKRTGISPTSVTTPLLVLERLGVAECFEPEKPATPRRKKS